MAITLLAGDPIKQNTGVINNFGTPFVNHALVGPPASVSISTKGAIHALTRQLAAEFGKYNIRVNSISTGVIRTPLHDDKVENLAFFLC